MKHLLKAFIPPGLFIGPMALLAIIAILHPAVESNATGAWLLIAFGISIGSLIFFLPTIIAGLRDAPSYIGILIVNTVGGLFLIGWIAALIWAFVDRRPTSVVVQNIYNSPPPTANSTKPNHAG